MSTAVAERVTPLGGRWTTADLPTEPGTAIQFPRSSGGRVIALLTASGQWQVLIHTPRFIGHYTRWLPTVMLYELEGVDAYTIIPND